MTNIIFATTNPGKFSEAQKIFAHYGIQIKNPSDFGVKIDIEEVGITLEKNAQLKAESYLSVTPPGTIIIGDDTGIEIDALGGEPGIRVRRWKGYHMQDEEIIEYCLERIKAIPKDQRGAQFRSVLAVARTGMSTKYFDGILRGLILSEPINKRREGMPFWPLFYDPKLKMSLGQIHEQSIEFQLKHPTHREKAVLAALPYLKSMIK